MVAVVALFGQCRHIEVTDEVVAMREIKCVQIEHTAVKHCTVSVLLITPEGIIIFIRIHTEKKPATRKKRCIHKQYVM